MPSHNLKTKIEKVVLNIGLSEGVNDKKALEAAAKDLMSITGQKPAIRQARKAIAGFKLKKGDPIGLMVTLRGKRKDDFLKKLINIVLPRIRDFQGLSGKSFDGKGNYSLGLAEQIVFPEVDYATIDKVRGLQITLVTNVGKDDKAKELLTKLGMPFSKE
jgi:large subunit ribosomal protein L5